MTITTSSLHTLVLALGVAACLPAGLAVAEEAQSEGERGRYTMTTTPEGVVRLDTTTGKISTCSGAAGYGVSCYLVPDERAALDAEIGRLQAENERLKAQLAARDQSVTGKIDDALPKDQALPKSDQLQKAEPKVAAPKGPESKSLESKAPDGSRKLEIPLPSDQDMDRVMGFLEQAWRRLIDMASRVQKDVSGKI